MKTGHEFTKKQNKIATYLKNRKVSGSICNDANKLVSLHSLRSLFCFLFVFVFYGKAEKTEKVSGVVSSLRSGRCDLPCEVTQSFSACRGRMSSAVLECISRTVPSLPSTPIAQIHFHRSSYNCYHFLHHFSSLLSALPVVFTCRLTRRRGCIQCCGIRFQCSNRRGSKAQCQRYVTTIYCALKPVVATTTCYF